MERSEETKNSQPVVMVVKKSVKKNYKYKAATAMGIIHVICGVLAITANINVFFVDTGRSFPVGVFGTGIWSSVFFFISGGLSIGSGRKPGTVALV